MVKQIVTIDSYDLSKINTVLNTNNYYTSDSSVKFNAGMHYILVKCPSYISACIIFAPSMHFESLLGV